MQRTLKLLSRYLARHKFTLLAVALLVILSSAANIAGTYLFKPLINEYIIPRDFRGLVWALLAMAVMYFTGVRERLPGQIDHSSHIGFRHDAAEPLPAKRGRAGNGRLIFPRAFFRGRGRAAADRRELATSL